MSHKSEEKMLKKMKMTLQRAKNLVHTRQHYGVSYYEKKSGQFLNEVVK